MNLKLNNTYNKVLDVVESNAASDFVSHSSPQRNTSTYQERNFERIIYGHPILDALFKRVGAGVQ